MNRRSLLILSTLLGLTLVGANLSKPVASAGKPRDLVSAGASPCGDEL